MSLSLKAASKNQRKAGFFALEDFVDRMKVLKTLIKDAKTRCFLKMCDVAEHKNANQARPLALFPTPIYSPPGRVREPEESAPAQEMVEVA